MDQKQHNVEDYENELVLLCDQLEIYERERQSPGAQVAQQQQQAPREEQGFGEETQ